MSRVRNHCDLLQSLIMALETKDPNFTVIWLNQIKNLLLDEIPILVLLLTLFKLNAAVNENSNSIKHRKNIIRLLEAQYQII